MSKPFRTLDDAEVSGKRVLLRVDLNVPTENGKVTDTTRIERVAVDDHRDRRQGRQGDPARPFRPAEGRARRGQFAAPRRRGGRRGRRARRSASPTDCIGEVAAAAIAKMKNGDILLLENTRFYKGEEKNDPAFVEGLAKLGDVYVNDAFSAAHRAHASTEGVAHKLPAFAGRAMQAELEALTIALGNPERPVAAIVGGAKVSTKLELLGNLINKVDVLIIGGGMANTFLFAQGKARRQVALREGHGRHGAQDPGRRREGQVPHRAAGRRGGRQGVQGARAARVVDVGHVAEDEMILDIGPKSVVAIEEVLGEVQDAGLERPVRRVRDAAVRGGDLRHRQDRRRS